MNIRPLANMDIWMKDFSKARRGRMCLAWLALCVAALIAPACAQLEVDHAAGTNPIIRDKFIIFDGNGEPCIPSQ